MRGQSHASFCGPASLANALRALGVTKWSEDKLVDAIKVSAAQGEEPSAGIGVPQLQRAAEVAGYDAEGFSVTNWSVAWRGVRCAVVDGAPEILAVDWEKGEATHWIAAIGVIGERLVIADPAHDWVVSTVSADQLKRRWKSDTDPESYYSLHITKATKKRTKKNG